MANRWNIKSQRLPRPKVCKPQPPPEGEQMTCSVTPRSVTGPQFDSVDLTIKARNKALPTNSNVEAVLDYSDELFSDQTIFNNDNPELMILLLDAEPDTYEVEVVFTFVDQSICRSPLTVIITA